MSRFGQRNRVRDWGRLAAKLGLLLTDPKLRNAIGNEFRDRMENITDRASGTYEDAMDRLAAAGDALQGRRRTDWYSSAIAMALGFGIGAGVGMLLAPNSGRETRQAIRDRAADLKSKVVESTSSAMGSMRSASEGMRPTGTEM